MLVLADHGLSGSTEVEKVADPYEIVHATTGRVRVRVPRLASDRDYERRLHHALNSLENVVGVRVNRFAGSVIVNHDGSLCRDALFVTIARADGMSLPSDPTDGLPADDSLEDPVRWAIGSGKVFLNTLGTLGMTFGVVGLALPLLPGTPFVLFASLCFLLDSCLPE